jgi:hypothetical protein
MFSFPPPVESGSNPQKPREPGQFSLFHLIAAFLLGATALGLLRGLGTRAQDFFAAVLTAEFVVVLLLMMRPRGETK